MLKNGKCHYELCVATERVLNIKSYPDSCLYRCKIIKISVGIFKTCFQCRIKNYLANVLYEYSVKHNYLMCLRNLE